MPETTTCWADLPADTPFGLDNLPYGVFTVRGVERDRPRVGVAVGDRVLDVGRAARAAGHPALARTLDGPDLNPLLRLGRSAWTELRGMLRDWLTDEDHRETVEPLLLARADVEMHLPFHPGDYVDFYSSEHHAANLGRILRPNDEPLKPNWKHLPVGYHGRAGTVVASGTPIVRPRGQRLPAGAGAPEFGPSARLDIEAEMGFVVGGAGTRLGEPVPVEEFRDHVFGAVLVNDWSARDIQAWEYVPLGPFLAKSFATSVGEWVVPLDALEEARTAPPERDVELLDYLRDGAEQGGPWGFDVAMEVRLNGERIAEPPFASMYWTAAQQLAHLTVNGAVVRAGDLFASGTVSGPEPHQWGSLMELTRGGREPLKLADGEERTFLADGDEVVITATAPGANGSRIGFGEVAGRIAPARR
ncbi:fumarylacetoacetase [Mangrovactinospora gilvigrisea]|uniref:fumarylacetoacetase n=1 Tax=Mangrovactinospora gilvigrisea TaxID=1428644 RepID=A0A1J7BPP9_9ACTN|nr:fumarylacetoacetase [Mangrovactinospora gilvigrisea]OIV35425.1 fumarylacetoacetase [Mangrovactinospora gilvigrisea]